MLLDSDAGPLLRPYVDPFRNDPPDIRTLWRILDRVWDDLGTDAGDSASLENYYSHPIWLFNGLVLEHDPACRAEKCATVELARPASPSRILDFGGGIGSLLKIAHERIADAETLDLLEAAPWHEAIANGLADYPKIRIVREANGPYDVVFCTEVMEHLPDPFAALVEINRLLPIDGLLIATWSFFPMMKAHLAANFHLEFLLHRIILLLGFDLARRAGGDKPIFVFRKVRPATRGGAMAARTVSRASRPWLPVFRLLLGRRRA